MAEYLYEIPLQHTALVTAGVFVVAGLWLAAAPAAARAFVPALGRHPLTGWTLAAIDLVWSAWLLYRTPLGSFDPWKPSLYAATPVAFFLVVRYVDELLGARSLGGLLLLAGAPVLHAARWMETPWRFVMIVLAYIWAIAGIALVLSPYLWRRWTTPLMATDKRARLTGIVLLGCGVCLAGVALAFY